MVNFRRGQMQISHVIWVITAVHNGNIIYLIIIVRGFQVILFCTVAWGTKLRVCGVHITVSGQNPPGQNPPDKIPLDKIPPRTKFPLDKIALDIIPPVYLIFY